MDKEEVDLIIAEQNKSTKEILKAVEEMRVHYQELCRLKDERIKDLEKENAELKKQLGMSNKVYNDNLDYSHHIEGQLIKAKRYIKELLKAVESSYSVLSWQRPPIKAEAEQFLNDDGCFDGFCEDCTKDCGIKKLGLVEVEK